MISICAEEDRKMTSGHRKVDLRLELELLVEVRSYVPFTLRC